MRRLTSISASLSLVNLTVTLASFFPLRLLSKSGRRSARIERVDESPSAKSKLSTMFDLPEPLGPEIVVNPSRSGTSVCFPNDLKLSSSISLIRKWNSRYSAIQPELDYTLNLVSRTLAGGSPNDWPPRQL